MKHLLLLAAAAAFLPAAAIAQDAPAAPPADAAMAAKPLPKCSAKIQDSCDQSQTTEKNAIDHYPADCRDAGNNKICASGGKPHAMARSYREVDHHAAEVGGDDARAISWLARAGVLWQE